MNGSNATERGYFTPEALLSQTGHLGFTGMPQIGARGG